MTIERFLNINEVDLKELGATLVSPSEIDMLKFARTYQVIDSEMIDKEIVRQIILKSRAESQWVMLHLGDLTAHIVGCFKNGYLQNKSEFTDIFIINRVIPEMIELGKLNPVSVKKSLYVSPGPRLFEILRHYQTE